LGINDYIVQTVSAAAVRPEHAVDVVKRKSLMLEIVREIDIESRKGVCERHRWIEPRAEGHHLRELTHSASGIRALAVGQRHAEDQVRIPVETTEATPGHA
jgi:hypothetical protein